MSETACNQLVTELENTVKAAQKVLKMPSAALGALSKLLNKVKDTSNIIPSLPSFPTEPTELLAAFTSMLDCPLIANSPQGALIASAVDSMQGGLAIPEAIKTAITNDVKAKAATALSDANGSSPIDKIDRLSQQMAGEFYNLGIPQTLNTIKSLSGCIDQLCSGYTSVQQKSFDLMDSMEATQTKCMMTDEGTLKDIVEESTTASPETKADFAAKKAELSAATDAISSFSIPF